MQSPARRPSADLAATLSGGNSINALRLFLAGLVVVSHSMTLGGFGAEPVLGHTTVGAWALAGFFAISGYLVTGSRISLPAGQYLWRRFLRIYPGFLVCLLVTTVVFAPWGYWYVKGSLHGFLSTPTTPVHFVVSNLALKIQAFDISNTPTGVPYPGTWNGSLWTLYLEFACYLVVGVAAFWALFRRSAVPVTVLFVAVSASALVYRNSGEVSISGSSVSMLLALLPFFLAGAMVRMLAPRIRTTPWWAAIAVVPVGLVAWLLPGAMFALAALPFAYLLMWSSAVLPLQRVGRRNDISYGIYIYSFPVQQSLALVGWQRHGFVAYVLAAFVVVVPIAFASWFGVERPAMRWGRRVAARWSSARARRAAEAEPVAVSAGA